MAVTTGLNLLQLPYAARQMIVVADDAVVAAAREAEQKARTPEASTTIDWLKVGSLALEMLAGMTEAIVYNATRAAIDAWAKARQTGLPVLQIASSEANLISFPPGHPRQGVLYIGHPAKRDQYYSAAEFHRMTFEHKFSEAVSLLAALGATKMRVEHVKGWSREFSGKLSVPLGQPASAAAIAAGSNKSADASLLFEATLKGKKNPIIPPDLVWYHHEHTWQMISNTRMTAGLQDFSLSVTYEDDFGINASLKASIAKSGIEVGGKFEDHQSTIWRITGNFREWSPPEE